MEKGELSLGREEASGREQQVGQEKVGRNPFKTRHDPQAFSLLLLKRGADRGR